MTEQDKLRKLFVLLRDPPNISSVPQSFKASFQSLIDAYDALDANNRAEQHYNVCKAASTMEMPKWDDLRDSTKTLIKNTCSRNQHGEQLDDNVALGR